MHKYFVWMIHFDYHNNKCKQSQDYTVIKVHLLAISSCVFVRTIGVYSEACFSVAEGLVCREEDQNGSFRGIAKRLKSFQTRTQKSRNGISF
jgi:hypothetical protein